MIPLFLTWVIRQVRVPFMKTVTRDGPFMDHRLVAGKGAYVTQWRYEPCHAGSPKTNRSKWKVQTKHDPLEERMANHSSILAARTPWTVWKGKKIWHRKMSPRPPGRKVSSMLLGKSGGQLLIAPERMKRQGHSGNDVQLWMCLMVKVKSNTVKNNIAQEPGMLGHESR